MKATLINQADTALDTEEQEILDAFEQDVIVPVSASKAQRAAAKTIANRTLKRDERINIRLSSMDLGALKSKAGELGMPYQTLVSAVLHQYVTGRLVPSASAAVL